MAETPKFDRKVFTNNFFTNIYLKLFGQKVPSLEKKKRRKTCGMGFLKVKRTRAHNFLT